MAGLITAYIVAGVIIIVALIIVGEGTKAQIKAQAEIYSQQGQSCPLEKSFELQNQFDENAKEFITSGELGVITEGLKTSGASTAEDQLLYLGTEGSVAAGNATNAK